MNPIVSIVISVYNSESFIEDCLRSIPSLWADKIEVVIVDDCSNDNSLIVINKFYGSYPEFNKKIIRLNENKGVGYAKNQGLVAAQGKYIVFVDSDDVLIPNDFEILITRLIDCEADLVIGNVITSNQGKESSDANNYSEETFNTLSLEKQFNEIAKHYRAGMWKNAYRREFIEGNNLYINDIRAFEDDEWIPRVVTAAKSILYFNITWYIYRKREGSVSTSHSFVHDLCRLDVAERIYSTAEKTNNKELRKLFFNKSNWFFRKALRNIHKHTPDNQRRLINKAENIIYIIKTPNTFGNSIKYLSISLIGLRKYIGFINSLKREQQTR